MNQTLIDNLRYVLQNMRIQPGDMAKVQADIVAQAIGEIESMGCRIEELQAKVAGLERTISKYRNGRVDPE